MAASFSDEGVSTSNNSLNSGEQADETDFSTILVKLLEEQKLSPSLIKSKLVEIGSANEESGDLECFYGLTDKYIDELFNTTQLKSLPIFQKIKLRQVIVKANKIVNKESQNKQATCIVLTSNEQKQINTLKKEKQRLLLIDEYFNKHLVDLFNKEKEKEEKELEYRINLLQNEIKQMMIHRIDVIFDKLIKEAKIKLDGKLENSDDKLKTEIESIVETKNNLSKAQNECKNLFLLQQNDESNDLDEDSIFSLVSDDQRESKINKILNGYFRDETNVYCSKKLTNEPLIDKMVQLQQNQTIKWEIERDNKNKKYETTIKNEINDFINGLENIVSKYMKFNSNTGNNKLDTFKCNLKVVDDVKTGEEARLVCEWIGSNFENVGNFKPSRIEYKTKDDESKEESEWKFLEISNLSKNDLFFSDGSTDISKEKKNIHFGINYVQMDKDLNVRIQWDFVFCDVNFENNKSLGLLKPKSRFTNVVHIEQPTLVVNGKMELDANSCNVIGYKRIIIEQNGILSVIGWNGNNGGKLMIKCKYLEIKNGGMINLDGKGYRGGGKAFQQNKRTGWQGESISGLGKQLCEPNNGGGGGGTALPYHGSVGGGGGGHGTMGDSTHIRNVFAVLLSKGGNIYGDSHLTKLYLGSGGGSSSSTAGAGGNGGGMLKIECINEINIESGGTISVNGENAQSIDNLWGVSGGGGGSGGSLHIITNKLVNHGTIEALGGKGARKNIRSAGMCTNGGNGGFGRIRIECNNIIGNGTVTPQYAT